MGGEDARWPPMTATATQPPYKLRVALCIHTMAVEEVDAVVEDARGVARDGGGADDGGDEEGGRVGCLEGGVTERPRPKAPDDAAGPARCHPQFADIRRPGWNM